MDDDEDDDTNDADDVDEGLTGNTSKAKVISYSDEVGDDSGVYSRRSGY